MPPQKRIRTLAELSVSATARFVEDSCKKIEETFPAISKGSLSFDSKECKSAVQRLQDHLRQYIPPLLWEDLFHEVLFQSQDGVLADERILFSTFLYDNVYIRKFKIPRPTDNSLPMYIRRAEFWTQTVKMIPNLTELTFDPKNVECDKIIRAFSKTCSKLEVISLPNATYIETLEFVIQTCKKLKKIKCDLDYVEDSMRLVTFALEHLENLEVIDCWFWVIPSEILASISHKLKLTKLELELSSPEDIWLVAELCPDLVELGIEVYENPDYDRRSVFQILSESVLKISKLTLYNVDIDYDAFATYLCVMGIYITDLSIMDGRMSGAPLDFLEVLSKCPNLTNLSLAVVNWSKHFSTQMPTGQISFPKLKSLHIDEITVDIGLVLAKHCLDNAEYLTRLELLYVEALNNGEAEVEQSLIQLFTHQRMRQLTNVLLAKETPISALMARHIVEACPAMTCLVISPLTEEATIYFQELRQEVTRKNLDFNLC